MGKLIPIILAIVGIVAGGAIGYVMKPAPEPTEAADGHGETAADEKGGGHGAESDSHGAKASHSAGKSSHGGAESVTKATDSEYMPLSRKLIVPFRRENGKKAFVAIDINLELAPGETHHAEVHEPKLVDAFLRTLIAFAATGAFDDDTHASYTLNELNSELLNAAQKVLGHAVRAVLIANLLTQDA